MSREPHADHFNSGVACPCCLGAGQITGPKSFVYRYDPDDPFNRVVRLCDECEGTGVITAIRAAALESHAMDKVLAVIDKTCPDLRDAAIAQQEREMAKLVADDALRAYAAHRQGCPARDDRVDAERFCNCGLGATLDRLGGQYADSIALDEGDR